MIRPFIPYFIFFSFFLFSIPLSHALPHSFSREKEAPTEGNTIDTLGLTLEKVTWEDIQQRAEKKPLPAWSGDSLSLVNLGLANRASGNPWESMNFGHPSFTYADQILSIIDLSRSFSLEKTYSLSTAEKWDLLLQAPVPGKEWIERIQKMKEGFSLEVLLPANKIMEETKSIRDELQAIESKLKTLQQGLGVAEENNDVDATSRLRGEIQVENDRATVLKNQISEASKTLLPFLKNHHQGTPSLAGYLKNFYPLSSDAWFGHSTSLIRFPSLDVWSWYGHCHGAALANTMEQEVNHGVLTLIKETLHDF